MTRIFLKLFAGIIATTTLMACAGQSPLVSPHEPHGIVASTVPAPARDQYAVRILEVDGRPVPDRPSSVWLRPGMRTLTLVAFLGGGRPIVETVNPGHKKPNNKLEINVQEGRRYLIAAELKTNDPDDIELKVIEDTPIGR